MELNNFKLGSYGLKEFPGVFSKSHNYILSYQIMESQVPGWFSMGQNDERFQFNIEIINEQIKH